MEGFYINFQEPLVQQTNSLFSTQITDDLDDNFTQTDEFGIDIIDDKNDAVEMKVGDSFKDWDMNQYFRVRVRIKWFEVEPSAETIVKIIISQGIQSDLLPLHHIERLRISNVYTETVRETVNKKIQFGTAISVAKTGVQIAVSENATAELIGILTQFIMKYRNNNGLGVKEIHHEIRQPLSDLNSISEIANPEYHRTKGRPPKRYKSSVEINTSKSTTSVKTCSYCLGRGHNIRGCAKYKLDKKNQISV
ncbi:hypothetical protein RhiirA4_426285 [Rhizophagus irregularis]|uniref:Uncharacterized protein n=1 Tax=Rhizophagus irregularis TaxID=588596 RepID=A0A2I1H4K5_9GLOM|nr:hypothetical protein RhiirA4_426285 [Rhizophagus irregularis]